VVSVTVTAVRYVFILKSIITNTKNTLLKLKFFIKTISQILEINFTDFIDKYKILDFTCQLDNIPKKKDIYDAILCTEVLEHVEYPQKVVNELYRILKKNGKLFLTVPQAWMIHQEPYNFYYFTKYGLASLLKNAGFKEYKIIPKGGYFWFLADAIRFNEIAQQYKKYPLIYYPLRILGFPFTSIIFPFILFYLDFLDKEKKWTMGYVVEAKK